MADSNAYSEQGRQKSFTADSGQDIFGADSAENDDNLKDYFVTTGVWERVVKGRSLVVLGRKGSGKSAICRMLVDQGVQDAVVVKVTPQTFALDVLNSYIKEYQNSPLNKEIAYLVAWKYSILLELMMAIEKTTGQLIKVGDSAGVHDWLVKNIDYDLDIVTRFVEFMRNWQVEKVSISDVAVAFSKIHSTKRKRLVGTDINLALPHVQGVLSKHRYIIAIDKLDEGWSNTEEARTYLSALVIAAKELKESIKNLSITIFMRTDMYKALEEKCHAFDKFRESIDYIIWNPTSLQRLISKRIQRYYNIDYVLNDEAWARIFPETMKNEFPVYKHIIERTFLRPREIIQFCRHAVDTAAKYKKNVVEVRDIYAAEEQYSAWKISDLSGEYSAYYNNVSSFLHCFRRNKSTFTSAELVETVEMAITNSDFSFTEKSDSKMSVEKAIEFLYRSGFLRARDPNNNRKYISSANEPDLVCKCITDWDMHPAFRSKLIFHI